MIANDVFDFDSDGPVSDGPTGFDTPIDSILKWGRRVTNVNVNTNIASSGDTLKNVEVTKTSRGIL